MLQLAAELVLADDGERGGVDHPHLARLRVRHVDQRLGRTWQPARARRRPRRRTRCAGRSRGHPRQRPIGGRAVPGDGRRQRARGRGRVAGARRKQPRAASRAASDRRADGGDTAPSQRNSRSAVTGVRPRAARSSSSPGSAVERAGVAQVHADDAARGRGRHRPADRRGAGIGQVQTVDVVGQHLRVAGRPPASGAPAAWRAAPRTAGRTRRASPVSAASASRQRSISARTPGRRQRGEHRRGYQVWLPSSWPESWTIRMTSG